MRVYDNDFGFIWGFIHVEREVSNDGENKQKQFNLLRLRNTKTNSEIKILATKEGFEITHSDDVVIKGDE